MAFDQGHPQQWGAAQPIPAGEVGQIGKLIRLVNLQGQAHRSEVSSIAVFSTGIVATSGLQRGITLPGGPLVGVANFSSSGGGGQIEFDVPCNVGGAPANNFCVIPGGGSMICFPGAAVDLGVRNDANYIPAPAIAGGVAIGKLAFQTTTPQAQACTGIGSKTGRLTRSVWLLNTGGTGPPFLVQTPVPPFARTFRVFRQQTVAADVLQVNVQAPSLQIIDSFNLPGTILSPDFVVGPGSLIEVSSPVTNVGTVSSIVIVFTLQMGGE